MNGVFLRLLAHQDKAQALADAAKAVRENSDHPDVYTADPEC